MTIETPPGGLPPGHLWRLVVPVLALSAVCFGLVRFGYGYFVPAFREDLQIGSPVLGAVAALGFFGYLAAVMGAWILIDHIGVRTTALTAGLIVAGGLATVAFTSRPGGLALGMFVAGTGTALALPPALTTASWLAHGRLADQLAIGLAAATGVGIVLVPLAAHAAGGGRMAWAGFAALAAATAAWSFTALPARQPGQRSQLPDAITRLADPPPRPLHLGVAASLAGLASSPMWIFWRDVQERSELGATLHPASTLVFAGIGVLVYLPLGGSLHRPDPTRVFNGAMLFLGGASAAFGATTSAWAALTAAAVFGGTYAVACGALLRWGATQSATSAHGIRFALLFLFVGHAVGAAVAGEVLAVTAPANAFVGAGVVAGLAATLGLLGHLARRAVWRGRVALAWIMGRPNP